MDNLTPMQQLIVDVLIANPEASNQDIADALCKSVYAIRSQLTRIYKRLGIPTERGRGEVARERLKNKLKERVK